MKTVYGPILPILGGGVDSVLMGILLATPKKFQEMVDFWENCDFWVLQIMGDLLDFK